MHGATVPIEPVRKVTSVVRADTRSGHLVRSVVVSPKVAIPKSSASGPAASIEPLNVGEIVDQAARAYDLDPALVHSIIKVESNYNPYAISNKGAEGLMQLVPATAKRLGVKNSFNAKENIEAGVRYYKYLRTVFGDDRLALAAYNAGEGAVAKYNFKIPPYPETVDYVERVGKHWGEETRRRKTSAPDLARPTAAAAEVPLTPEHPKLELSQDEQGRLSIWTAR